MYYADFSPGTVLHMADFEKPDGRMWAVVTNYLEVITTWTPCFASAYRYKRDLHERRI
jgi:hypothetical protein